MPSAGFYCFDLEAVQAFAATVLDYERDRVYGKDVGDRIPQPEDYTVPTSDPTPVSTPNPPAAAAPEPDKTPPRHPLGHYFVMASNHVEKFGDKPYPFVTYPNLERARAVAEKMAARLRVPFLVMENVPETVYEDLPASGAEPAGKALLVGGIYELERVG